MDTPNQPEATPKLPALPDSVVTKNTLTWPVPNLLISAKDGHATVREGGPRQLEHTTEAWFSEEKQEEPIFRILARNVTTIAGARIEVLNDADEHDGRNLAASNPSASEYLAQVGKPVTVSFDSTLINPAYAKQHFQRERVFRNIRITIILP